MHKMSVPIAISVICAVVTRGVIAVDIPADHRALAWIESYDSKLQYIDSGYVPSSNTVIRARFRPTVHRWNWVSFFGVFDRGDNTNYGVVFRNYDGDNILNGTFCNANNADSKIDFVPGRDYDVELKSGSFTLTDAVGSTVRTFTSSNSNANDIQNSIYIFCEHLVNSNENIDTPQRYQNMRLYSMTISEADGSSETLKRDFRPCMNEQGKVGLWDAVEGEFYGNLQPDGDDFRYGGLPVVWTGSGADDKWSTTNNWYNGEPPLQNSPVTLGVAAGGTTTNDIDGLSVDGIVIPATSGAYAHNGGVLVVNGSITNNSTAAQTFNMLLSVGTAGATNGIGTAGDLTLSGGLAVNAAKLELSPAAGKTVTFGALSGGGALEFAGPGDAVFTHSQSAFSGPIEVSGGTVSSTVAKPFARGSTTADVRVGVGTLHLGGSEFAENSISYELRRLVLAGNGLNNQGAVTYNGGRNQYHTFHHAMLDADSTVSCASGRWDIRKEGSYGAFDFNGHSLTKIGAGMFGLSNMDVTTGDTPVTVNVNEGTLLIENGTTFSGDENTLKLASGAALQIYQLSNPVGWTMNFAGGSRVNTRESNDVNNKFSGPMTLGSGTFTFDTQIAGNQATLASAVSGEGKLLKAGVGTLRLTGGAKTFTGGLEISNGRVHASDASQIPGAVTGGDPADVQFPANVSITGNNTAGLLLSANGWGYDAFKALAQGFSVTNWRGYLGLENDTASTIEVTSPIATTKGGIMLHGSASPVAVKSSITLEDGVFVASGDVEISGSGVTVAAKRVELMDKSTTLTVKDGATLKVTDKTSNVGDIVVGQLSSSIQRLVVDNATVACDPPPTKGAGSASLQLGIANNGVGILEVKSGGSVSHKIAGAVAGLGRSSIIVEEGGTITNYCGSSNDGYIAANGCGYMENNGTAVFKGWSQVIGGNGTHGVGVLYNAGDLVFTGEYDGNFEVSRGQTGVVYQTSGTIEALKNGFQMNSQHGQDRGLAIWTVDGEDAVTRTPAIFPVNRNGTTSIINLREGGTFDYGSIKARNNDDYAKANTPFYVNLDGGFLKPQSTGTVFYEGERYQPNKVVAFAGGAGFDIGEGVTSTLNFPISKPEGRGIASITPSAEALAQTYVGAPYVNIMGDGYGATAVAIFDYATKRITGIKVTSPGCNYTTATVTLVGGRADNNNEHTATATLTDDGVDQACGGIVKRGAGRLVIGADTLPAGIPVTVADGTLDLGGATQSASSLTLRGGRIENGAVATTTFVVPADDMIAGRHTTMSGTLAFAEGSTLTIPGLVFDNLEARKYVLVEAEGGIEGFENLTTSAVLPKEWVIVRKGNYIVLKPQTSIVVIVR